MCKDAALTYLNELGYNVVRFPRAEILPLDVIGRQRGSLARLGRLEQLVLPGGPPPPPVRSGIRAANLESQRSSRLGAEAAVTVLGSYLRALGGEAKVSASFRRVKSLQLVFTDVLIDVAAPAEMGAFLGRSLLDAANLVWQPYLAGEGELFVITEVLKSRRLTVDVEAGREAGLALDASALQAAVGGKVGVSGSASSSSLISFDGSEPLTFGFKCVQLRIEEGKLALVNATPSAALAFSASALPDPAAAQAALEAGEDAAPILLGEGLLKVQVRPTRSAPPESEGDPAPLPEEDSPWSSEQESAAMLYVRLQDSALVPRAAQGCRVQGPARRPTIDLSLRSDEDGVLLLDGCPPGVYQITCEGLRFEIHTVRASDLLPDGEPVRLIVCQAQ